MRPGPGACAELDSVRPIHDDVGYGGCTVCVAFSPTAASAFGANLRIVDDAYDFPSMFNL